MTRLMVFYPSRTTAKPQFHYALEHKNY